ncbi:MAG: hypothetical protein ABI658_05095 [Acidimicrobiales bacterium]
MNDRRRPRVPAKPKPSPQLTGPVQLDDETRNALILFNARLVAQDELEREKRRVDKAAKAKDDAAAKVRELEANPKATAPQKSEAQAAYLASLDALNRAKAGEPAAADTPAADDDTAESAEPETEAAATAMPEAAEPEAAEPEAAEPEAAEPEAAEPETAEAAATAMPEAAEPEASEPEPAEDEPVAATDAPEAGDES